MLGAGLILVLLKAGIQRMHRDIEMAALGQTGFFKAELCWRKWVVVGPCCSRLLWRHSEGLKGGRRVRKESRSAIVGKSDIERQCILDEDRKKKNRWA